MTRDEFISTMRTRGALFWGAAPTRDIAMANNILQSRRMPMLPRFITDFYAATAGANMGNGYIFGPTELVKGKYHPIPSILEINDDIKNIPAARGKTVFGRNDLFWFAFDAFGVCYMLDNLTLGVLRKYDDPYRAMADCLIAGKF